MATAPVLPTTSPRRDMFAHYFQCLCLTEKQIIVGLVLCSLFYVAQCALGVVFGWSEAWRIVGGFGLPWFIIPALATYTKLQPVMMGAVGMFLGQEITSIVAINYAQNVFFDRLAVALNSVFLVTSLIGAQLAVRFRKIHTPELLPVGAIATQSPLSSNLPLPPV
jgi:hypothetical protein